MTICQQLLARICQNWNKCSNQVRVVQLYFILALEVRAVTPVPSLLTLLIAESRKRTVSDLGGESDSDSGSIMSSRKVAKSEP